MTEATLDKFRNIYEAKYGSSLFMEETVIQTTDGKQSKHILVFTENLKKSLQEMIGAESPNLVVSSLEREGGTPFFVKNKPITLYTQKFADPKYLADELLPTEKVRILYTDHIGAWTPVVVEHEFRDQTPVELGWIQFNPDDFSSQKPGGRHNNPDWEELFDYYNNLASKTHYQLSGKTIETGIDCSGLTQRIYHEKSGIWLPRLARWQSLIGKEIDPQKIQVGDLIYFQEGQKGVTHVGLIYQPQSNKLPTIIHSSSYNNGIKIEDLNSAPWINTDLTIAGYKRI